MHGRHGLTPVLRACCVLVLCLLSACSAPRKISYFSGTIPAFDPVAFWTGHVQSWGVIETPGGAPSDSITTDCQGRLAADGTLHLHQTLTEGDGTTRHRDWTLRRLSPTTYEASANDMAAPVTGTAAGRAFTWHWVWELAPHASLKRVTMTQWMYLLQDGTLLNRTIITKFGVTVAEVTEHFHHVP